MTGGGEKKKKKLIYKKERNINPMQFPLITKPVHPIHPILHRKVSGLRVTNDTVP